MGIATLYRPDILQRTAHRESAICWQSEQIGLLYYDEQSGEEFWDALEDLRENVLENEGQFISLDLVEPETGSLSEMFYDALKSARWDSSLQISLPVILQHNSRLASPFLNQAILWQRLCDLIILDDDQDRETVLVLENINQTSPEVQHEIARLVRFHQGRSIRRTFVFTLDCHSCNRITLELRALLRI